MCSRPFSSQTRTTTSLNNCRLPPQQHIFRPVSNQDPHSVPKTATLPARRLGVPLPAVAAPKRQRTSFTGRSDQPSTFPIRSQPLGETSCLTMQRKNAYATIATRSCGARPPPQTNIIPDAPSSINAKRLHGHSGSKDWTSGTFACESMVSPSSLRPSIANTPVQRIGDADPMSARIRPPLLKAASPKDRSRPRRPRIRRFLLTLPVDLFTWSSMHGQPPHLVFASPRPPLRT